MLSQVEQARSRRTNSKKKSQLGQFFTPPRTAQFMAALFEPAAGVYCRLLDSGAGAGSLSGAFLERYCRESNTFKAIEVEAFEIDATFHEDLRRSLSSYANCVPLRFRIVESDFIEEAVNRIQFGGEKFTHAILNPPYKKINSNSRHRHLIRQVGIETVNLYSAFVALTIELMGPGGQVVAIIPRSFCNGPYYRPFRNFLLQRTAIRRMHLFHSRTKTFKDDDVLQENIIIVLERDGRQGDITISSSTDDSFDDLESHVHPFESIIQPDDSERFIYVPISSNDGRTASPSAVCCTLDDIGINVSTGPVVDFRLKEFLRDQPGANTVPLLYPCHFRAQALEWPKLGTKKPNAIEQNSQTQKWLYPNGYYCVVRRFSSKEEKRRIVANVVQPSAFGDADALGFENHLNVFHEQKHGLPEALAFGLTMYLNTTIVDENFRRFNGHTQVNATDLRQIKYPSRDALITLGNWAMHQAGPLMQTIIDEQFEKLNHDSKQ